MNAITQSYSMDCVGFQPKKKPILLWRMGTIFWSCNLACSAAGNHAQNVKKMGLDPTSFVPYPFG